MALVQLDLWVPWGQLVYPVWLEPQEARVLPGLLELVGLLGRLVPQGLLALKDHKA